MNIHTLLSTKERVSMLEYLLYKTEDLAISGVARDLGLSKGLVSKFFGILTRENILTKAGRKFAVRQKGLGTRAIKMLLNIGSFDAGMFGKFAFVRGAGLYGSLVKGENTEGSDIDLWLLINKTSDENLARLTNELKKRYGEKIKPLYLTEEKINVLKREEAVFYHSLVFGSVNVYGEEIETI